jgi:glycerol-3-phosphate dehydrogenase
MTTPHESTANEYDVIVIGGGINGAGIARDAALRGLSVVLLDKGDLGSGTSSWSSRLIHGGLRYLEHREFGLVRESLRERELLLRNAVHLVRPLPMLIPIYRGARRSKWMIRAGMLAYDTLSAGKSLPRHRMLSVAETLRQAPGLKPDGLQGAALYYDAQVEFAERLVLENALDAQGFGAQIVTYATVTRLLTDGGRIHGVEYTDREGRREQVTSRVVLNVAGPWVDQLLSSAGTPRQPLIGGTKGSHLIVDPFPAAPLEALYSEARSDGRPFFILPWNGLYLIGTTDNPFTGDLDNLAATEPEIDYLLEETNWVLPEAKLTRAEVRYTYAGVRPLPYEPGETAGAMTRRHFLRQHTGELSGLISVIGGKLTTYRELAEQAVDLAYQTMGSGVRQSTTATQRLPGAVVHDLAHFHTEFHREHPHLPHHSRQHLLHVYGARALDVVRSAADHPELMEVLDPHTGAIKAEVPFAFEHELAQTLADCLLRRTMVGLNRDAGLNVVEKAARVAQQYLDWSGERAMREVTGYRTYVARFHPAVDVSA